MMANYSVLKNAFHLVQARTLWSSARKPFWPASHGGRPIHVSEFQNILRVQRDKIMVGLRLANDPGNDISSLTYLGKTPLSRITPNQDIANYLYLTGIIHPRFFAEALHVIASNSKALAPHTLKIQFGNLGRDRRLAKALDSGVVNTLEIGKDFSRFSSLRPQEKLQVLQRLGVLQLKRGSRVTDIFAEKTEGDPQLDLFDRLK